MDHDHIEVAELRIDSLALYPPYGFGTSYPIVKYTAELSLLGALPLLRLAYWRLSTSLRAKERLSSGLVRPLDCAYRTGDVIYVAWFRNFPVLLPIFSQALMVHLSLFTRETRRISDSNYCYFYGVTHGQL